MLPQYNTKIFTDVYPDFDSFKHDFDEEFGTYAKDCISSTSLQTLYWLLYSRYANNPIVNYTEIQFRSKIVSITFQKAPTWERKLGLQKTLRELSDADLLSGARTIFNSASHDGSEPSTLSTEETTYIDSQNVSKQMRSKLDAYSYLQDILKNDVSEELVRSYKNLFSKFVSPTVQWIYENDIEDEEEEEN